MNPVLLQNNMRLMSSTDEYFRKVLNKRQPKTTKFEMVHTLAETMELEQHHEKRREHIRENNKINSKFGIRDYNLDDYQYDIGKQTFLN